MQGGTHSAARFRTCARLACFARRNTGMASFSGMGTRRLAHRHIAVGASGVAVTIQASVVYDAAVHADGAQKVSGSTQVDRFKRKCWEPH